MRVAASILCSLQTWGPVSQTAAHYTDPEFRSLDKTCGLMEFLAWLSHRQSQIEALHPASVFPWRFTIEIELVCLDDLVGKLTRGACKPCNAEDTINGENLVVRRVVLKQCIRVGRKRERCQRGISHIEAGIDHPTYDCTAYRSSRRIVCDQFSRDAAVPSPRQIRL
jgi:hypothetical protein